MSTSANPAWTEPHPLFFEGEAISWLRGLGKNHSSYLVLTDSNTRRLCYPHLEPHLPPHNLMSIQQGEASKQLQTCLPIWEEMNAKGTDRGSLLICLGGGVVTDLGGFVASVYKRGIATAYIPTTLMAMVDASLGGKTGLDLAALKNQIGTFHQPEAVLVLPELLDSLPSREWMNGWAEVWKHVMLAMPEEWESFKEESPKLSHDLLRKAIGVKMALVSADPLEHGVRQRLNLGHTAGHALEAMALATGQELLHGEAVAFGLLAESEWACKNGLSEQGLHEDIKRYYQTHYQHSLPKVWEEELFSRALAQDKKNRQGQLRLCLLEEVGKPIEGIAADPTVFSGHCREVWQGLKIEFE